MAAPDSAGRRPCAVRTAGAKTKPEGAPAVVFPLHVRRRAEPSSAHEDNRRRGSRLPHARRSSTNHRSESAATEASHTDGPGRSTVVSVRDDGGGYCALVYHLDHLVRSARMFSCPPFGQQFDDATGEGDGWREPSGSCAFNFRGLLQWHPNYPSLSLE